MQQCWRPLPDDRPSFCPLTSSLSDNLTTMANYLTLSSDFETTAIAIGNEESVESSARYVRDPTLPREQTLSDGYIDLNEINAPTIHRRGSNRDSRVQSSTCSEESSNISVVMGNEDAFSLSDQTFKLTIEDDNNV